MRWCLAIVLFSFSALADVVVLESGESLSGKAIRIQDGVLLFRTSLSGQMAVPADTLKSLRTDSSYLIQLVHGESRYGRFAVLNETQRLLPLDGGPAQPLDLAAILSAEPIPAGPGGAEHTRVQAEVESGVLGRFGTEDALTPYLGLRLRDAGAGQDWELRVAGGGDLEGGGLDFATGVLSWRYLDSGKFQPFLRVSGVFDEQNRLKVRGGLSLGVGRVMAAWERGEWWVVGGLHGEYEARRPADDWLRGDAAEHSSDIAAVVGGSYLQTVGRSTEISGELLLYPSLGRPGDVRVEGRASAAWPLGARLRLRLHAQLGYDSAPLVKDMDKATGELGAGVGVRF